MMARLPFLIVSVLALGLLSPETEASNCAVDQYDHNGSLMEAQVCDGGDFTITYIRPRKGIANEGVSDGTLLFDGVEGSNGVITGEARIFSRRCGPITYTVTGSNKDGSIVLRGRAPVRNRDCDVVRHRRDTLVFTLQ